MKNLLHNDDNSGGCGSGGGDSDCGGGGNGGGGGGTGVGGSCGDGGSGGSDGGDGGGSYGDGCATIFRVLILSKKSILAVCTEGWNLVRSSETLHSVTHTLAIYLTLIITDSLDVPVGRID